MSEMMKNPRVMEQAQAEVRRVFDGKGDVDETGIDELKFLKAVVSETLRLHPPFPLLLPRECREKCKINGYEVPVKTRMTINAWAIGRDPDYWTEAERFYPERFLDSSVDYKGADFGFIPFDAGRRMCPGILFAIPSIELPLAHLLFHFDWELPNGMRHEDLDMTEVHGLSAKRKHSLHLIPIPYNS
uniref:Cytochrome P450 71D10 n=1 Tax=Vitis vinifera TaxID=29760 RepID=F6I3L8_VITVI